MSLLFLRRDCPAAFRSLDQKSIARRKNRTNPSIFLQHGLALYQRKCHSTLCLPAIDLERKRCSWLDRRSSHRGNENGQQIESQDQSVGLYVVQISRQQKSFRHSSKSQAFSLDHLASRLSNIFNKTHDLCCMDFRRTWLMGFGR